MSDPGSGPWGTLKRTARRVRADASLSVALAGLAVVPVVLLLAWGVGDGWGLRTATPLVLLGAGLALAVALVVVLFRRWVAPLTDAAIIAATERSRGLPEGSLRGVVELREDLPPGVSAALFRQSERALARRLEGTSPRELAGDVGQRTRRRRRGLLGAVGGLVFLTTAAAFGTPDRARAGWTPLLHPVAHIRGPALPPLVVAPGDAEVPRGDMLEVGVTAPFRSHVTVEWRAVGDVPRQARLVVEDDRAAGRIGPVDGEIAYRVRAPDGAASGTFRARPVDPLLLAGLGLDVVYPPHVAREAERIEGEIGALSVPEGTLVRVRGHATRSLESAVFRQAGGREQPATADGAGFALDWRLGPADAGVWALGLRDVDGADAVGTTIRITVDRDAPPRVRVLVPGTDTLMPPTLRQPIVADAMDDHGLTAAALVHRRIGAGGERGQAVRTRLDLPPGQDRARIETVLDASTELLAAGDVIEYHVEVRDNAPAGQVGRSATYRLRLPSMTQRREQARRHASELLGAAERAALRSRELDRATRDLARRGTRGGPTPARQRGASPSDASSLDFDRAREIERLVAEHDDASRELDTLREQLKRLREAIDQAGLRDAALQRRLDQLRELQHRLSAEDRERALDDLRAAADDLDPEAAAEAIEELMRRQEELRRHLDEHLGILQQAVTEQEMSALAREAEEIAAEQELLAAAMRAELGDPPAARDDDGRDIEEAAPDSARDPGAADADPAPPAGQADAEPAGGADAEMQGASEGEAGGDGAADADAQAGTESDAADERAAQQDALEERTRRLTDLLESLQRQLLQRGDSESASQAGSAREKGESAQESMRDAADQARRQEGEEAAQSGERAASDVAAAAEALDDARSGQGRARQEQIQRAVEEATQDALQLAEREEALRRRMDQAQRGGGSPGGDQGGELQEMQSEQAAVRQGLEQLGRNLAETSRQTEPLDREVGQALARAMLDMDRTMEGLRTGTSMPVREAERTVESLNRLAMALLDQDARIRPHGSPAVDQALERLAELAREQAALNAQVGAFAPLEPQGRTQEDQVRQLADAQRGIARRAGEVSGMLGGREDVLGRVDELAVEGSAIARELEGGRLDAEVRARQERLFHRLLDAGRSLEREEYTDERVGEVASQRDTTMPPVIDPAAWDTGLRYPAPTGEQLRGLPAAYRRLILDYFDRLNATDGQSPSAVPGEEHP